MVRKSLVLFMAIIFVLSLSAVVAAVVAPIESIRTTIDSVLETMRDKALSNPDKKSERRTRIGSFIRDRFDFKEMSKRSLAKHWKKRTPEEKAEFIKVFSDLLETSYINKIEAYTDEKVTYDKETLKGKGKYSVVNTTIVTKSVEIPIDYKLINRKGKWWVYDVVIEGVSFVSTYRSQYNKIIIKKSYADLIQSMREKLNKQNANTDKGSS